MERARPGMGMGCLVGVPRARRTPRRLRRICSAWRWPSGSWRSWKRNSAACDPSCLSLGELCPLAWLYLNVLSRQAFHEERKRGEDVRGPRPHSCHSISHPRGLESRLATLDRGLLGSLPSTTASASLLLPSAWGTQGFTPEYHHNPRLPGHLSIACGGVAPPPLPQVPLLFLYPEERPAWPALPKPGCT